MVKFVDDELRRIRSEVLDMWTLVYDQMDKALKAVMDSKRDDALEVLMREKKVNASELKLDCDIEDLLALYTPVAIDLRFALAMIKINADLERIGDFAENIARFVLRQNGEPVDPELLAALRFKEMADGVLDMLGTAKEALEKEDIALANSIFEKDNLLDEINGAANAALAGYAQSHQEKSCLCFDMKGVFLRLERTGDHVINLAEEIVFYIDAEVLKHTSDKTRSETAMKRRIRGGDN